MKITIDTKEDSPAEIRKAINLLTSLANAHPTQKNIFEPTPSLEVAQPSQPETSQEPAKTGGFMNMFSDVPTVKQEKEDSGWDDKDKAELLTY